MAFSAENVVSSLKTVVVQIILFAINVLGISKLSTLLSVGFRKAKHLPTGNAESERQRGVDSCKSEFLKVFGEDYGYPGGDTSVDELRHTEFRKLNGLVYLDHAGTALYGESQMQAIVRDLTTNIYGNPHSQNDSSVLSSELISSARQQVLDYCNASSKDYKCIFTSGATAALKLVGETFPWSSNSHYLYTMENHNSVLGIREYALNQGAAAIAVDIEGIERDSGDPENGAQIKKLRFHGTQRRSKQRFLDEMSNEDVYNLFAFPLECNFSGAKFELELVRLIQEGRHVDSMESASAFRGQWMVLLDAAKGCGTKPPDLSEFPVDFVALSFYKIFGYPTGLGALIVRTEAAQKLQKSYFSGGTVAASVADIDFVRKREGLEQWFEDGTASFLSIAALQHGFRVIKQLGISNITRHTGSLTAYTSSKLAALRHGTGVHVCVLYGRHNVECYQGPSREQGPVVTFNLRRSDGSWIGYREVEKLAAISGIHLRTGCFCNPGACSKYLELSPMDLQSNFESGHVCWDDHDIIFGRPTGAIRVSFGYMSTFEDAQAFINFIDKFFVSKSPFLEEGQMQKGLKLSTTETGGSKSIATQGKLYLDSIIVYPIKSCAGFNVDAWPLSDTGLLYDREWLIVSASGEALTQKKVPLMCTIGTFIDHARGKLIVTSPNTKNQLQIPLQEYSPYDKEEVHICGKRFQGMGYGSEVMEWFTKALGRPCTLLRRDRDGLLACTQVQQENSMHSRDIFATENFRKKLSFVNDGQLLLVSKASVRDLNSRLESTLQVEEATKRQVVATQLQVEPMRFRPNLVVSGGEPYEEDDWHAVTIGKEYFTVLGGCNRCQMINIDPQTGCFASKNEPLATLASYRRIKGKILFGALIMHEKQPYSTSVPMVIGTEANNTRNYQDKPMLRVGFRVIPEKIA